MRLMIVLVTVIMLVAVLIGPAGAQSVYHNDDPTYPAFEVNAQTNVHPATTWAERAAEWIKRLGDTSTGKMVQIAAGLYNALVNKNIPVTQASINF